MKEIVITNKDHLAELLGTSLESALIVDKDLNEMIEAIHNRLGKQNIEDEYEYNEAFSELQADFLLAKYQSIVITSSEQVLGRNGQNDVALYDGTDTKVFLDAQFLN